MTVKIQRELREIITKQNGKNISFEKKLDHLDSNIIVLKSKLALAKHASDVMRKIG